MSTRKSSNSVRRAEKTPFLEWLLGGVGVMLLFACVTFLVYEGLSNDERPGPLTSTVLEVIDAGDAYVVTFTIRNAGSQTLSNLHITGRLFDGDREIETAMTELDYLPGRSAKQGGFYFQRDPRGLRVDIQPGGYLQP